MSKPDRTHGQSTDGRGQGMRVQGQLRGFCETKAAGSEVMAYRGSQDEACLRSIRDVEVADRGHQPCVGNERRRSK